MSRAGSRAKAVEDALRKVDHAVTKRRLDMESVLSTRHRPVGDGRVPDSGRLGPGERSEDYIRERQDQIEETFRSEAVAAFVGIDDTIDAVTRDAEADLVKADEARRRARDYKAEDARRPEIHSLLAGEGAGLGEGRIDTIAKLAEQYRRLGDRDAWNALRTDPEVRSILSEASLTPGPTGTTASNVRGEFREAEREERAEVAAIESEIASYRTGEVARAVAAAEERVRAVAGKAPEPEPEGAEA